MAMHVDYIDPNLFAALGVSVNEANSLNVFLQVSTECKAHEVALELAQHYTGRSKAIILVDHAPTSYINKRHVTFLQGGHIASVCEAIAVSEERIAAIVVRYFEGSHFYYKKIRELASAEGAVMIWDYLIGNVNHVIKIYQDCMPDMVLFHHLEQIGILMKNEYSHPDLLIVGEE